MKEYLGVQFIEKDFDYLDGKIKTYQFGTGSKKIIALPGFPNAGLFYLMMLRDYDLSKITLITLDIPGWIGQSDDIYKNRKHKIRDYINIVESMVQFYDLEQFSVLGYSFGAGLTLNLSTNLKSKIDKVALISGVYSHKFMKRGIRHRLLRLAKILRLHGAFRAFFMTRFKLIVNNVLSKDLNRKEMAEFNEAIDNVNSKTLLQDADELFRSDFSSNLEDLDPTKLMIGYSKDEVPYFVSQAQNVIEYYSDKLAEKIVLEGAHEDLILKPSKKDITKIFDFLSS